MAGRLSRPTRVRARVARPSAREQISVQRISSFRLGAPKRAARARAEPLLNRRPDAVHKPRRLRTRPSLPSSACAPSLRETVRRMLGHLCGRDARPAARAQRPRSRPPGDSSDDVSRPNRSISGTSISGLRSASSCTRRRPGSRSAIRSSSRLSAWRSTAVPRHSRRLAPAPGLHGGRRLARLAAGVLAPSATSEAGASAGALPVFTASLSDAPLRSLAPPLAVGFFVLWCS